MMLGFASFAVIPSLLWLWIPTWLPHSSSLKTADPTISPPSLIVSTLVVIMWCLGVWKSRFLDSNWVMFGIETVLVLLICVMSSYAVGMGLSYVMGDGISGLILTNQSH